MAANTNPIFLLTPNVGTGSLGTANTNRDGTGTIATVFTAGANGSRVHELSIKSTGQPADSTVVWYIHDGTNYFVWDEWDYGAPAAGSATVASYREARSVNVLLPTGYTIRASITATPTSGTVKVIVLGGDY